MKVFIDPTYTGADRGDGGIRRVSDAMVKYLPEFGWQITTDPNDADLIVNHGAALTERPGVPMIAACHGLMWSSYGFGEWGDKVNKAVIETLVRANAITAPSRWVAQAISRGMLAKPTVIYHGVDADDWQHSEQHQGYVLWNKARADQVSDPGDMQRVAALLPHVRFVSTFGDQTDNVMVTGPMPYEQMRLGVQQAGVYLATARETFGIGTLEALASGVPIAGWRYGGQEEIVIEGETGYLVEYGDYDGLAQAIMRCLAGRDRLSRNCVQDARERWGWKDKIAQYAALFDRTLAEHTAPRPAVSVIITAHNLGRYLPDALGSVAVQTMTDWECLIVDDQSTDNTAEIARQYPAMRYLKTPRNLKLSGARNYGFQHARGRYIIFLDADDMLAPNALDILSGALDARTDLHIAYGSLDTVNHEGNDRKRNPWPAGEFSWHAQLAHLNQLHGSAMMRREVLERSGGYRTRDWRAEDASFWARVTSLGFRAAKVTEDTIQIYRMHADQKSRTEDGDGDWTAWFPWRLAGDAKAGLQAVNGGRQPNPQIVPFSAQGRPSASMRAWPVHHHQHPIISIIIPVGPGHAQYLVDALDSVQAQTMPFWECIVINDTGKPLDLRAWPWARLCEDLRRINDIPGKGAGFARNVGLSHARAPLVLFLDADDVIVPRALELLLRGFVESGGKYTYSDWLTLEDETRIDGPMTVRTVEDYDARTMLHGLRHAVTALIPIDWVHNVGGFDERLQVFEDWDLFCKLAIIGACGHRVAHPLLIYRRATGLRTRAALKPRENDDDVPAYTPLGEEVAHVLYDRYAVYRSEEESIMACGSCGGQSTVVADAQNALDQILGMATGGMLSVAPIPETGMVRMEFVGNTWGEQTYIGRVSGRVYRAGRNPVSRYHDVDVRDVEHLIALELFRIVPRELLIQAAQTEDWPVAVAETLPLQQRGRRR